jgi:hypothetical protein
MNVEDRLGGRSRAKNKPLICFVHKKLMEHGKPATTHTIYDWCKESRNRRLDVTMHTLGNVLSKNKRVFHKVSNNTRVPHPSGRHGEAYNISTWKAIP